MFGLQKQKTDSDSENGLVKDKKINNIMMSILVNIEG